MTRNHCLTRTGRLDVGIDRKHKAKHDLYIMGYLQSNHCFYMYMNDYELFKVPIKLYCGQ